MKLLLIAHNWYGEGTIVRALKLGQGLAHGGHEVTLLGTSHRLFRSETFVEGGVQVVLAPHFRDSHRGGWGWLDLPWRAAFSLFRRFDLVYAFDHKPNVVLPAWIQRVIKGVPLVSDWADWWGGSEGINKEAHGIKAWVEERSEVRIRKLAGWVTAISPLLKQRAMNLGLPQEQVLLLPGGADPRQVKVLNQAASRKKLNLEPKWIWGVFLGLGTSDLALVLQGLKQARQKKPHLGLLLLGPAENVKKQLVQQAGVAQACVIPGRVSDETLGLWLSAADFGVIPLKDHLQNQARWPNKVGEYAAAGLPVLTSEVGPLADILPVKGIGVFCESNTAGWAKGLAAIASSKSKCQAMGKRARLWATQELDWRHRAKSLEVFLKKAAASIGEFN